MTKLRREIGKRTRERAAMYCSIMACNGKIQSTSARTSVVLDVVKKISAQDREDAAVTCAIYASNPGVSAPWAVIGASYTAKNLAYAAFADALGRGVPEASAEAESMIRTGWRHDDL